MPSRDSSGGRRRHASAPDAPASRSGALRVALLAIVTAAAIAALGGGEAGWLCLPSAVAAAAVSRTRAGAAVGATVVIGLTAVPAAAWARDQHRPSAALILLVGLGCAAVVVTMRERLERDRDQLRDFALSDPVTGISNRRSLLIRADYEISRHRRAQRSFAVVMLDLDGFKQLNDRFGHAAGDDLLRDVATALTHAMRDQDTVARFGGDEFCVLAPETDERGSARLAAKVSQAVRDVSVGMETVGGSVGVAIFPADGLTASDLIHAADVRLLDVKRRRPRGRSQRHAA